MAQERSKLIITLDGAIVNEYFINKDSISIGRKLNNDIQLDELTVSGNHSLIQTIDDETFVKDNASTNGTLLNGVRIKKSALKHGDIIQIGNYQFAYHDAQDEYQPTMFIKAEVDDVKKEVENIKKEITVSNTTDISDIPFAGVRVLNGPLKSKVLELRKPFNTIGFDGKKLAIIARNPDGYTISALNDRSFRRQTDIPKINGSTLGNDFKKLNDHDVIELLETQIEFFYYR